MGACQPNAPNCFGGFGPVPVDGRYNKKELTPFCHYAMMDGQRSDLRLVVTERGKHNDGRLVPRLPVSGIRHLPVCRVLIL